jgi:hypothetical protein
VLVFIKVVPAIALRIFVAVWDSGVAGVWIVSVEAILPLPPIWQAVAVTVSPGTAPDEQ